MGRVFHILMVEDDLAALQLFKYSCLDRCIRRRLHHVPDGPEALAFLRKELPYERARTPDLIILDLNLPKMSGLDVLSEIKSDPTLRVTPVVILTSSENPADVHQAYQLGAACFINKPVDLDEMVRALEVSLRFWFSTATLPARQLAASAR